MQKILWAIFGAFVGLAISLFFRTSFQLLTDLPTALGAGAVFGSMIAHILSETANAKRYGCWLLAICAALGAFLAAQNIPIDGKLASIFIGPIIGVDVSLTTHEYLNRQTVAASDKRASYVILVIAGALWVLMTSILSIMGGVPLFVFMVLPLLLTIISFNSAEQKLWVSIAGFSIGLLLIVIYAEPIDLVPTSNQWILGMGLCALSIQSLVRYFLKKKPVDTFPDSQ